LVVQVKVTEPDAPEVSVALTVTDAVPAAVGLPVMSPVLEAMARPAGRPVDVQVSVWPLAESVPLICRLTEVASVVDWLPGLVTVTVLDTFHVNVVVPLAPEVSVAVRVTAHEQAAVGVPDMVPVVAPIVRPAGSPVADQVKVWLDWESVARAVTLVTALPDVEACADTDDTVTRLFTVQAMTVVPEAPVLSVALTVTEHEHGAEGVPVMDPEVELIDRPVGRPVADQVNV